MAAGIRHGRIGGFSRLSAMTAEAGGAIRASGTEVAKASGGGRGQPERSGIRELGELPGTRRGGARGGGARGTGRRGAGGGARGGGARGRSREDAGLTALGPVGRESAGTVW